MSPAEADQRGQAIWDELQTRVEKVVEALLKADQQGSSKRKSPMAGPQNDGADENELDSPKDSESEDSDDDDEPDVYA